MIICHFKGVLYMNYRQIKAIEKTNKTRILNVRPDVTEESGIYILTREENGFKFAYIGQAKRLLTRLAQHLTGYQHIDISIRKHGLWNEDNLAGWNIHCIKCPLDMLDELEQRYIKIYANYGYQLRNHTSGSQGKGKTNIVDTSPKGYLEGLHNGYKKAQKEIAHLFKLHLVCATKKQPPTKLQEKALAKFEEFIAVCEKEEKEV